MINKTKVVSIFLFLTVFIMLVSCRQQKTEQQVTTEEVDGVTVVKNPGEPIYGEFTFNLMENLSIGGDPQEDNYYFPRRVSLTVDDQGNVYVLDTGNFRVQKYDNSGHYLASIGRKGQGPGEFQFPSKVELDGEGNLWVFDSPARALKVFTKDGTYKKSITIRAFIQPYFYISQEGFIFGYATNYRSPSGPHSAIMKIHPDGSQADTIARFEGELRANQTWFAIHYYSNHLSISALNPHSFFYGFSSEYRIFIADGLGRTIRIIEKYEEPAPISKEEKEATIKDGKGIYAGIGSSRPREKGEGVIFPSHRPFFRRIFADDEERIYVTRYPSILEEDETKVFDVFGKDGSYLYRSRLTFMPELIKAGSLYEIQTDEETGDIRIIRYEITNWDRFKTKL